MSYAVYVVRFDHGEPVGLSAEAFAEVFGPHVTETQPQFHFHRLVAPDGGDAEIYADLDPPFDSLSFGRVSPGDVCVSCWCGSRSGATRRSCCPKVSPC